MAKTDYKTVEDYLQAFSGEMLDRLQIIRKIVLDTVPDVEETISYQIPCFKYHGYLLYYCAFPKHISLSHSFSDAFWNRFKADLEGYKTSKAAIQFPHAQPLPTAMIKEIATFRKQENELLAKTKKSNHNQ